MVLRKLVEMFPRIRPGRPPVWDAVWDRVRLGRRRRFFLLCAWSLFRLPPQHPTPRQPRRRAQEPIRWGNVTTGPRTRAYSYAYCGAYPGL